MDKQKFSFNPEYGSNDVIAFYSIRNSSDEIVASTWLKRQDETARRIVSCLNACAGIPTETLEAGSMETTREVLSAAELKQQRDELLTALQESKETLERECTLITDTLWYSKTETLFDFMDAAIAKATA